MRSFKKDAKIGGIILVAVLVIAQFIRVDKTNPPAHAEMNTDASVQPLLKRACYDCHSNETVWPWYSDVAPVSWLIGSDVSEGRGELNFSEWNSYPAAKQVHKLNKIGEEVESKGMPPWYYAMMHKESRLSPEERGRIKSWTTAVSASMGGK